MTIKNWVLGRVQKTGGLFARSDLPRNEPGIVGPSRAEAQPQARHADGAAPAVEHLGFYAALVGAIRDELEHFVASHVRLHLAIADHDRFLLTAIQLSCADSPEARKLLHQFMHEFKPEQVKRYLAREVIGALPNAAAIDLSQFAGLMDAEAQGESDADSEYGELLAALRIATPAPTTRAYRVSIIGRWTERDGTARAMTAQNAPAGATPTTSLSGPRCDFDIEDADGRRRVVLHGVNDGRRYLIGKDAACDIRVKGTFTSRRHAEIWLDGGRWHVTDAGSTNGLRVESPGAGVERCAPWTGEKAAGAAPPAAIALVRGARILLSAHAEGPASDYPSIAPRLPPADVSSRVTPIATGMPLAGSAAPKTPLTPIHSARSTDLLITVRGSAGPRSLALSAASLPVTVGRSRNQTIVIGRAHELVSGHHLDIESVDEQGAQVQVHGDNGVTIDGTSYAPGARLRWKAGQSMVLGAAQPDTEACTLTLTRRHD